MKSVLISIQPYWVFLIIAKIMGWEVEQHKNIEVRKNFPQDEKWDKIAKIYCSKDRKSFNLIPKKYQPLMQKFLGKIIGEFTCDKIYKIDADSVDWIYIAETYCKYFYEAKDLNCCLSDGELYSYSKGLCLYGWHISNLKIYDKPKELSEFYSAKCDMPCENKKRGFNMDFCMAYENGSHFCKELNCDKKRLTRPPQSWCYVESGVQCE